MNTDVCAMNVSTKFMYDNFWASMGDNFWDIPENWDEQSRDFLKIARGLSVGCRAAIRDAFQDGYTMFLLGDKSVELENMEQKEIRVYHDEKLICVLVDGEIVY